MKYSNNPTNAKEMTNIHKTQEQNQSNNSGDGQEIQDHMV